MEPGIKIMEIILAMPSLGEHKIGTNKIFRHQSTLMPEYYQFRLRRAGLSLNTFLVQTLKKL